MTTISQYNPTKCLARLIIEKCTNNTTSNNVDGEPNNGNNIESYPSGTSKRIINAQDELIHIKPGLEKGFTHKLHSIKCTVKGDHQCSNSYTIGIIPRYRNFMHFYYTEIFLSSYCLPSNIVAVNTPENGTTYYYTAVVQTTIKKDAKILLHSNNHWLRYGLLKQTACMHVASLQEGIISSLDKEALLSTIPRANAVLTADYNKGIKNRFLYLVHYKIACNTYTTSDYTNFKNDQYLFSLIGDFLHSRITDMRQNDRIILITTSRIYGDSGIAYGYVVCSTNQLPTDSIMKERASGNMNGAFNTYTISPIRIHSHIFDQTAYKLYRTLVIKTSFLFKTELLNIEAYKISINSGFEQCIDPNDEDINYSIISSECNILKSPFTNHTLLQKLGVTYEGFQKINSVLQAEINALKAMKSINNMAIVNFIAAESAIEDINSNASSNILPILCKSRRALNNDSISITNILNNARHRFRKNISITFTKQSAGFHGSYIILPRVVTLMLLIDLNNKQLRGNRLANIAYVFRHEVKCHLEILSLLINEISYGADAINNLTVPAINYKTPALINPLSTTDSEHTHDNDSCVFYLYPKNEKHILLLSKRSFMSNSGLTINTIEAHKPNKKVKYCTIIHRVNEDIIDYKAVCIHNHIFQSKVMEYMNHLLSIASNSCTYHNTAEDIAMLKEAFLYNIVPFTQSTYDISLKSLCFMPIKISGNIPITEELVQAINTTACKKLSDAGIQCSSQLKDNIVRFLPINPYNISHKYGYAIIQVYNDCTDKCCYPLECNNNVSTMFNTKSSSVKYMINIMDHMYLPVIVRYKNSDIVTVPHTTLVARGFSMIDKNNMIKYLPSGSINTDRACHIMMTASMEKIVKDFIKSRSDIHDIDNEPYVCNYSTARPNDCIGNKPSENKALKHQLPEESHLEEEYIPKKKRAKLPDQPKCDTHISATSTVDDVQDKSTPQDCVAGTSSSQHDSEQNSYNEQDTSTNNLNINTINRGLNYHIISMIARPKIPKIN